MRTLKIIFYTAIIMLIGLIDKHLKSDNHATEHDISLDKLQPTDESHAVLHRFFYQDTFITYQHHTAPYKQLYLGEKSEKSTKKKRPDSRPL